MYVGVVLHEKGEVHAECTGIADVFADFCGKLYKCRADSDTDSLHEDDAEALSPVMVEEIQKLLKRMSNRKSPDVRGVVAKLVKCSS